MVGQRLDQGAELRDLLLHGDRRGVGASREHTDVDDPRPRGDQIEAALQLLVDTLERARVGDRVAADVEDAHHDRVAGRQFERRLAELELH